MTGQPSRWGAVGASNTARNHSAVTGEAGQRIRRPRSIPWVWQSGPSFENSAGTFGWRGHRLPWTFRSLHARPFGYTARRLPPVDREVAVVRYQGNRRKITTYGELARMAGRFAAFLVRMESARETGAGVGRKRRGVDGGLPRLHAARGPGGALDAFGTVEFAARVAADVRPKLAVGDARLLRQLPVEVGGERPFRGSHSSSGQRCCPPKRPASSPGFRGKRRSRFYSPPGTTATPKAWCSPTATCWPAWVPSKMARSPTCATNG